MNLKDAYRLGYDRGYSIADYMELPYDRGLEEAIEYLETNFQEIEDNDRSFSPFEFTARDLNNSRDPYRYWEEFDRGINNGLRKKIREIRSQIPITKGLLGGVSIGEMFK
jgi:hypothetical protein